MDHFDGLPTNRQSGSLHIADQPGVIERSLSWNLEHRYPRRSVDVGEHPRRTRSNVNRNEEPELRVSRERHNVGEIIAWLPLLPVLDHH
jgi:hypothetical protein